MKRSGLVEYPVEVVKRRAGDGINYEQVAYSSKGSGEFGSFYCDTAVYLIGLFVVSFFGL